MIAPIETVYKGIRFRSRLEARWAVFFNSLNFKFVYEPEGYNLNGIWYLPDFWISDWQTFIEIKPEKATHEQRNKCQKLSDLTNNNVLLIAGQPWLEEYTISLFEPKLANQLSNENDDWSDVPLEFAQDRKDETVIWLAMEGGCGGITLYVPPNPHPRYGEKDPLTGEWANNIMEAFKAARQERFGT